ncbi:hypothetical protein Tco_0885585 [Tanacetum coccineum]
MGSCNPMAYEKSSGKIVMNVKFRPDRPAENVVVAMASNVATRLMVLLITTGCDEFEKIRLKSPTENVVVAMASNVETRLMVILITTGCDEFEKIRLKSVKERKEEEERRTLMLELRRLNGSTPSGKKFSADQTGAGINPVIAEAASDVVVEN